MNAVHLFLMDFYNVRFLMDGKTIHAAQKYYKCIFQICQEAVQSLACPKLPGLSSGSAKGMINQNLYSQAVKAACAACRGACAL